MKYLFYLILYTIIVSNINAQVNCEAYKYYGDTLKCNACKKAEEANQYYQFDKRFQETLDEVIQIDSTYAYAYKEKSVAYLKSGDFINWKTLMDKAVKYDPKDNLGYRGWCRYQFFRDYKGAIKDIEELERLVDYDIGMSVNGDYHLTIAKAICYNALGQNQQAIKIIEQQLINKDYYVNLFDYFLLGVWYLEDNQFQKALTTFEKQLSKNDLAEVHYYMALSYKSLNDISNYKEQLQIAKTMYTQNKTLFEGYTHHSGKIYLIDIENEINKK